MESNICSSPRIVEQAAHRAVVKTLCDKFSDKLARVSCTRLDDLRSLLRAERAYVVPQGASLACAGVAVLEPKIILKGWGSYQRLLDCGSRQVFSFIVPGDPVGNWSAKQRLQVDIVAVTPLLVIEASEYCQAIRQTDRYSAVRHLLGDVDLQHLRYLYDHIQRLGRQRAVERVYDLLWELFIRLGGDDGHIGVAVPFPLTQEMLADALGLSSIHINRTLQDLRRENLVTLTRGHLTVHQRRVRFSQTKVAWA